MRAKGGGGNVYHGGRGGGELLLVEQKKKTNTNHGGEGKKKKKGLPQNHKTHPQQKRGEKVTSPLKKQTLLLCPAKGE